MVGARDMFDGTSLNCGATFTGRESTTNGPPDEKDPDVRSRGDFFAGYLTGGIVNTVQLKELRAQ